MFAVTESQMHYDAAEAVDAEHSNLTSSEEEKVNESECD